MVDSTKPGSPLQRCFMIQPFDNGPFDKRFDEIYSPAIVSAGLEPYRVDRDLAADELIVSIEQGIKSSAVCLADITSDNPNVWYELGFAYALSRPTVMICSEERPKFPFDVSHRNVTQYATESAGDFERLRTTVTARLVEALKRAPVLDNIRNSTDQIAAVHGLNSNAIRVLGLLASECSSPGSRYPIEGLKQDADRAGLNGLGFGLAVRELMSKHFLETAEFDTGYPNGETYIAAAPTDGAWSWLAANERLFVAIKPVPPKTPTAMTWDDMPDDIPF